MATSDEARSGRRVLVVDDNAELRGLLRLRLEMAGFDVVGSAATGQEAVALAVLHEPDAVVTDHMMPGLTGIDSVPFLKQALPGVKVVVFSSLQDEGVAHSATAMGADAFVRKLEGIRAVIDALQRVLASEP